MDSQFIVEVDQGAEKGAGANWQLYKALASTTLHEALKEVRSLEFPDGKHRYRFIRDYGPFVPKSVVKNTLDWG